MDGHEILKSMADAARREPVPQVDVTADVLRRIHEPVPAVDRGLVFVTTGAAAAAAAALVYIISIAFSEGGSLTGMDDSRRYSLSPCSSLSAETITGFITAIARHSAIAIGTTHNSAERPAAAIASNQSARSRPASG